MYVWFDDRFRAYLEADEEGGLPDSGDDDYGVFGTFFVVSLVFGIIFWFADVPLYLAFMFGGIALATAPAPSLSVVNDMKTSGPVTRTLIPMAALGRSGGSPGILYGNCTGFSTRFCVGDSVPVVFFLVFLPVLLGVAIGFVTGKVLQHIPSFKGVLAVTILMLLVTAGTGFVINSMLPAPVLNFMLLGLAYFTAIANMVTEEQLNGIMKVMNPVIGFAMIVVILNLGAPLDYHLIFGAGINEVIAVFMAKKGFEWAGELGKAKEAYA